MSIRSTQRPRTVGVVIPCHNYGRYLTDAIDSVLRQTRRPEEVLVVDDASIDDSATVARAYESRGVRYLRVEERHSQRARRAGYLATSSDALVFLDADDALEADYLESGLAQFDDVRIGIVYSDLQEFSGRVGATEFPAIFDRAALARMNLLHTGCLVRREALDISRAFDAENDDRTSLQDWLLWRRILDFGWQAKKQSSLYLYRRHGNSLSFRRGALAAPANYFTLASLALETVSLLIPLSGRANLWPELAAFLDRQTWPHDQTRLVLFDTSQDAGFSRQVRRWLADCDYRDVRHWCEMVGEPGLADRPRQLNSRAVTLAMTRIYNRLAREQSTDYVWIVEDDILPPLDACERLLQGFDQNTASVSGVYRSRFGERFVVWEGASQFADRGSGLQAISGNGFGCVVIRGTLLRETVFTATIDRGAYDTAFYCRLPKTGLLAKVDWSVECQHHTAAEFVRIPASDATPNS